MQIIVNELLINYLRTGSGRSILIVPGWADTAANWHNFAYALGRDYEVIVLDLPGFGASQTPSEAWGLDDYANFVAAFCARLSFEPAVVFGHSNGGAIAITALASEKLHTDKLVLLASAGIRGVHQGKKNLLKFVAKTGKALSAPLPESTQKKLRQKLYKAAGSDLLVAGHMEETFKRVVAEDVRGAAAKLTLPTLLIYGDADDQTPPQFGEMFQDAIAGSKLEVLAGADHFLYRGRQDEVLQLAISFMEKSNAL